MTALPIHSRRLILQAESMADFPRFFAMTKDPEVMQYIGDGSIFHWTREVAERKYRARISVPASRPVRNLAVYRQDTGQYIGWAGITRSRLLKGFELGYRFCRDAWNQGFATEATAVILQEAFRFGAIGTVRACVHPDNQASMKVLIKNGFVVSQCIFSKPIQREMPVLTLTRAAWFTRPSD